MPKPPKSGHLTQIERYYSMSATQIEHSSIICPLLWRPDDREYWTIYLGRPLKLYWSEMTRTQKLLQIEAEQRAQHVEEFGIYC